MQKNPEQNEQAIIEMQSLLEKAVDAPLEYDIKSEEDLQRLLKAPYSDIIILRVRFRGLYDHLEKLMKVFQQTRRLIELSVDFSALDFEPRNTEIMNDILRACS